jgi:DNA-directed RNA polymerase subunit RPC12/RpoP
MDLAAELQKIYDSKINIHIELSWLWDGGIDVRLGDRMNGYQAAENVRCVGEILPWLQEAIAHFYPDSTYAKGLASEVHERAARRVFLPPRIGAQVRCPHCGSPSASHGLMDETMAFVCTHCGQGVTVEPPKPH